MIKYWCNKCKTYILEDLILSTDWNKLEHKIQVKNGNRYLVTFHKIVKVIEPDIPID